MNYCNPPPKKKKTWCQNTGSYWCRTYFEHFPKRQVQLVTQRMDSSVIWKVIEINEGVEHSKKRVSVPRFDPNRHPKRRWSRTWVNSSPHSSPNSQVCTQWSVEVWLYPPINLTHPLLSLSLSSCVLYSACVCPSPPINLTHPLLSLSFPVLYILFLFSTSIAFIQFCGVVFFQPWYNLLWLTGLKKTQLTGCVFCRHRVLFLSEGISRSGQGTSEARDPVAVLPRQPGRQGTQPCASTVGLRSDSGQQEVLNAFTVHTDCNILHRYCWLWLLMQSC